MQIEQLNQDNFNNIKEEIGKIFNEVKNTFRLYDKSILFQLPNKPLENDTEFEIKIDYHINLNDNQKDSEKEIKDYLNNLIFELLKQIELDFELQNTTYKASNCKSIIITIPK